MLKFIRGHSVASSTTSSTISNIDKPNTLINELDDSAYLSDKTESKCEDLNFDLKSNRILLEIKLNNVLHNKFLRKLSTSRKKRPQIKFQNKESSSLNGSCDDGVISCSDSAISRCTSSCGERSSLSELELSTCSSTTSDNEELINKCNNNELIKINNNDLTTNEQQINNKQLVIFKNDQQQKQSFKLESKRKSILLSNQVTKSKNTSISITAPKLLLPKDVLKNICLTSVKAAAITSAAATTLNENKINIRFHTFSLNKDVEYKTLSISKETTSKQVISILLNKFKLKHRDSNLYYITMEIIIRKSGIPFRNIIVLNNEACPAQLTACYPNDQIKFSIESKPGGLLRVYDTCLMKGSLYKGILVAENTTASELVQLMLNCYNSKENSNNYSLYVFNSQGSYKLDDNALPLYIQEDWDLSFDPKFQLRKKDDNNSNDENKPIKRWSRRSLSLINFHSFNHFYI